MTDSSSTLARGSKRVIDTTATWMLEEDHRVILEVIIRMATAADDLERGKGVEPIVAN